MNRFILIPATFAGLLVFAACDDTPTTTAPAGTTAAAAAPIADEDLAVSADFEDEAEKSITVATYKTELDALEKELN